jgi:hypothetical protein
VALIDAVTAALAVDVFADDLVSARQARSWLSWCSGFYAFLSVETRAETIRVNFKQIELSIFAQFLRLQRLAVATLRSRRMMYRLFSHPSSRYMRGR